MSKRNGQDFMQLVAAIGLNEVDAAKKIIKNAALGKRIPRWLRRAARTVTRRASAGSARA